MNKKNIHCYNCQHFNHFVDELKAKVFIKEETM